MSDTIEKKDHETTEPEAQPFRLIVTYKAGISLCVEVSITGTQQRLLKCLAASPGSNVPEQQLFQCAYGVSDAAPTALSKDMRHLQEQLARMMGSDAVRRGPDGGYLLATDKVLLSLPN